jgi:hypothetical protein
MSHVAMIARLHELLLALDSRQLHPDRPDEAGIARDAFEMRQKTVARLAELQRCPEHECGIDPTA